MPHDDLSDMPGPGGHGRRSSTDAAGTTEDAQRNVSDAGTMGLRIVNWSLNARRLREEVFGPGLFADPAWDILLDLFTAEARGERVQISSLAIAARVPHSTAIRWARIMTGAGLVVRERDPDDGRRVHVSLSQHARNLMEEYLSRLRHNGQPPSEIAAESNR